MADPSTDVTVFRSAEPDREVEAANIAERLRSAGIQAYVAGDDVPGVVVDTCEVRVPADFSEQAEALVGPGFEEGDTSPELDLVTIFSSQNHNAEMEALAIQSILESAGIQSVVVGASSIPSLPFEVQVARSTVDDAERAIAAARAAGPEAAEEAALQSEPEQPA
jgi:hypothetical protein